MLLAVGAGLLGALLNDPWFYLELVREIDTAFNLVMQSPVIHGVGILGSVMAVECGFVLVAILLMPWGARMERKRDTFRHALRRCWLQSPAIVLGILVFGLVVLPVGDARSRWFENHSNSAPFLYTPPAQPIGVATTSPEWKEYQEQLDAYNSRWQKHWDEVHRTMPWYVRHSQFIAPLMGIGLVVFLIWGQLRAAGAPRSHVPVDQPPLCETCGYDLTGSDAQGRCPECGTPVADSLQPDRRIGPPWEQRRSLKLWPAWCETAGLIWRPDQLGRTLHVGEGPTDHRSFLSMTLVIAGIIFGVTFCLLMTIGKLLTEDGPDFDLAFLFLATFVASVFSTGCLLLVLLVALGIGFLRLEQRRTLFPAAIQAACYLSPFLIFLGEILQLTVFLTVWFLVESDQFPAMGPTPLQLLIYFSLFVVVPNLIVIATFIRKVFIAVKAARFANR